MKTNTLKYTTPDRWLLITGVVERLTSDQPSIPIQKLIEAIDKRVHPPLTQTEKGRIYKLYNKFQASERQEKVMDETNQGLSVPLFAQPGLYMFGSSLLQKYPELRGADYWRAFQQALQLLRSNVDEDRILEVIESEYPTVDNSLVMKAAKSFLREGSMYIEGRLYGETFKDDTIPKIAAIYSDLIWQGASEEFVFGFKDGLPRKASLFISNMRSN